MEPRTEGRKPVDARLTAAIRQVRVTGKDGPAAEEVFRSLIAGLGRGRSLQRLRELEERIGRSDALDRLRAELEDLKRMRCPRCQVELPRRDMIGHLWHNHRLVLDGLRVRDPWNLIEEWVDQYQNGGHPGLLDRCRTFAEQLDAVGGPLRLHRITLSHGIVDPEARSALLAHAKQQRSSLCPHCLALVPAPLELPIRPLNLWRGRISGRGYRVEVSDRKLFYRLEIETPQRVLHRGRDPETRLTQRGAVVLFAGPLVLLALIVALGLPGLGNRPLVPVLILLLLASLIGAVAWRLWYWPVSQLDRAVDHAWTYLVPRLNELGFSLEDSAFAGGLALTSTTHGNPDLREDALRRVLTQTESAVAGGTGAVEPLAALHRLAISQRAERGDDPVPLVVTQMKRCFEGKLPLAFAEQLLEEWQSDWWTPEALARLRILLCDHAFEAGFEVRNLIEAGRAAPTLGAVLETEDADGLARLRLLWSQRPTQPWDRCGDAMTVFDVARSRAGGELLARCPDLLLLQENADELWEDEDLPPPRVLVCGRGIIFEGTLFTDPPRTIEVIYRPPPAIDSFELVLGRYAFGFRHNPESLATKLEQWFRYLFIEFRPRVAGVHGWSSPSVTATFRARETVACPECRRPVLPRPGAIAGALDEA